MAATFTFKGRKVLVTGGAGGLGSCIVRKFYEAGATVFALDCKEDGLVELQKELPDLRIVVSDLTKWNELRKIVEQLGPLDHLVNNAGVSCISNSLTVTEEEFDKMYEVNFKAVANLSQVFAKQAIANEIKDATIVTVSSIGSVSYLDHVGPAYCCSKAAVDMLTKALAVDLGPHGIRVNLVQPTAMDTAMSQVTDEFRATVLQKMLRQPINQFADVSDLTNAILYLSSSSSKMITGSSIPVDGGYLIG